MLQHALRSGVTSVQSGPGGANAIGGLNPRVDRLCQDVLAAVQEGQRCCEGRRKIFRRVWELAQVACELGALDGLQLARLEQAPSRIEVPYLTEPWYC